MSAGSPIRPFAADDLERVAGLFVETFRPGGRASTSAVADSMRSLYLDGPTADPELPSLVGLDRDGRVAAFIGVTLAPLTLGDRPLRAAISTNFLVAPGSGPLVANRLMSAFLAGAQDLSLTDTATETSARIWEHCGGFRCPAYSLTYTRALRPAAHAAARFGRRQRPPGAVAAARWLARPIDLALGRVPLEPFRPPRAELASEPIDLVGQAAGLARLARLPLHFRDEPGWLPFVLAHAALRPFGRLEARQVRGRSGDPLGAYAVYLQEGAEAEVLYLASRPRDFGSVFDALLADALSAGAVSLRGRAHPSQLFALSERRCTLACDMWCLVHTSDPEVEEAFLRGQALLTGLDTERWMRFIGDPFEA